MTPTSPVASGFDHAPAGAGDVPSSVLAWLGVWSRPPDRAAEAAFALAVALLALTLVPNGPGRLASTIDLANVADRERRRRFLTVASFAAAFLSLGYVAFYLRGGPRAPEASAYWLQGRALSHGALAWIVPDPTASFRAHHLLFRAPDRLSGIFPPGYPLLLAMGFLVGAPMLVGPLLAAALVVATWLLAHEIVGQGADGTSPGGPLVSAEAIARLAAGLSIVSAALRYHTADALPHAANALAVTVSLACALRAHRTGHRRLFAAAGLAIGFLVASHPASAVAVGLVVAFLATRGPGSARCLAWTCAAALPGLLLLLAANREGTGHALASPAAVYFAGEGESGRAIAAPLARSALRCAREHLLDIANLEPIALLALVPLVGGERRRGPLLAAIVIAGQALTHAFNRLAVDRVPAGAGPSLLVAVVPLEHVLIALGVARLFPRKFSTAAVTTLALALAGFAVHASHTHEALAKSDLGRPHFEPDVVREANVTHGLLFFDDDTGYELSHDPGLGASHGIEAARLRGDDHDRLLYDSLGHPPAHRYVATAASAFVVPWTPPTSGGDTWRFEAESDWPSVARTGGSVEVVEAANPCASDGRVLRVTPAAGREASVTLALPVPPVQPVPGLAEKRVWMVAPRVLEEADGGEGALALVTEPGQKPLAEWTWGDPGKAATCRDLPPRAVELAGGRVQAWLVVRARGGAVMVDKTTMRLR
jgi:hypothetical protein